MSRISAAGHDAYKTRCARRTLLPIFASHAMGAMHFPSGYVAANASAQPLGIEVAFVTADVAAAHATALAAGATELNAPEAKPWGQTVSYVRCPDGTLVELCSPIGA